MKLRMFLPLSACVAGLLCVGALVRQSRAFNPAQEGAPDKVDFARDVQPILRQNCVSCHGPKKQNGGLRLDRRSSVMQAHSRRVVAGNSANSMMFHRVSDTLFGPPMPVQKPLRTDEVAVLKRWIDQGAEWPDGLANEEDLAPIDPEAVAAVELLRTNAMPAFLRSVTEKPGLLNARGPEGSTPFMYAVLYADAPMLTKLLSLGANANAHNDAGATALMWGARDLAKTTVLLEHGADVNAISADFRTALMVAARLPNGTPIVNLLLEHKANPNPNERPGTQSSPLAEAATAGNGASFALLMQHGAVLESDAEPALVMGITTECKRCVELAMAKIHEREIYTAALEDTAFLGDAASIRMLLDHGADAKGFDSFGHTGLMAAVTSDVMSLEAVKLLVRHGADVNASSRHATSGDEGMTVLDMAKRHGQTPIVDYLVAAGAKSGGAAPVAMHLRSSNDLHSAIRDSLPLLQGADEVFAKNSGCVSCHNNSLTGMTVGMARRRGFAVNEGVAAKQVHVNVDSLTGFRDILHQGFLAPVEDNFSDNVVAYTLLGLHEEGYAADLDTDAAAMHILWRQKANGQWLYPHADTRQPLCLDYLGQTALNLRALQFYAPKTQVAASRLAIQRGAAWLAQARAYNNEDLGWQVIGLAWAGDQRAAMRRAMRALSAAQKHDGGWSDLPSMDSTAYATGKSLVALRTAGIAAADPVYQRGVQWLLTHQQTDGSWYVQTRALAFQPWADAGFPHKYDQFISAAGTNWAAMALTMALPEERRSVMATR